MFMVGFDEEVFVGEEDFYEYIEKNKEEFF